MPSYCPRAHQWLRSTLYQWLQSTQRPASRAFPSHIAARHVSTTSAINRGLRAEADSKTQSAELHHRDRSEQRLEQRRRRGFGARRGEVLVRKHAGASMFREDQAMIVDTKRTQKAMARNQRTVAKYGDRSSHVGEAESGLRGARGKSRGILIDKSAAAPSQMKTGRYTDSLGVHDQGSEPEEKLLESTRHRSLRTQPAETLSKAWAMRWQVHLQGQAAQTHQMNASQASLADSIITLRSILTHCRLLLQRIQEVQETKSPAERLEEEDTVETMVAELRALVTKLNQGYAEKEEVRSDDVRKALVTVLGLPGRFWTKAHPDGSKTMLFFDEALGNLRVLLQRPQRSEMHGPAKHIFDATGKQPSPEGKTTPEKYVQKTRYLLDRCRRFLETIRRAEEDDVAFARRSRPTLRLQEDKVVALIAQVNMLIEEGHIEWAAVMFGVKRELGKQNKFWTISPPTGTQTMIWVKQGENRLEVARKRKAPFSEEDSEILTERKSPKELFSTKPDTSFEPATSQFRFVGQAERDGLPERLPSREGWTETGERNGRRSKADNYRDNMPISVPHTTAASTFMYGSNAVLACLSAKKRKCYHLYISGPATKGDRDKKNLDQIEQLANAAQIPTTTNASITLLDRMSNRRPHNGVVLETSHVPAPPVLGLGKPDLSLSMMPVDLDRQSAEEVTVNDAPTALPILTKTWRHPFILMLDGILDEGNMGNIIRTAYFYGVDAIAVSKNTCASVNSAIVSKASSGAIEAVQILSLPQPSNFVYKSLLASWRVYAAAAPTIGNNIPANEAEKYITHSSVAAASPLRNHPCILMLGAEGEGLRDNLKNRADYFVSIEQGERGSMSGGLLPGIGVDSMNVASAAGVLVESFLRKPAGALPLGIGSALGF